MILLEPRLRASPVTSISAAIDLGFIPETKLTTSTLGFSAIVFSFTNSIGELAGAVYAYFLPFLGGSAGFLGLPIFTLRISSRVPSGYKASLLMGLIPARWIRRSMVLCGKPSFLAISVRVSPSILFIIGNYISFLNMFEYTDTLLNNCLVILQKKVKKMCFFIQTLLTLCLRYATL